MENGGSGAFPPDYGLTLLNRRVRHDFQIFFYSLCLDHVACVGPDSFTTLLNLMLEGKMYSMSLDFSAAILDDILEKADPPTASLVHRWVRDLCGLGQIDLPRRIEIGVCVTLGEKEQAQKEAYVPFIIEKVL